MCDREDIQKLFERKKLFRKSSMEKMFQQVFFQMVLYKEETILHRLLTMSSIEKTCKDDFYRKYIKKGFSI